MKRMLAIALAALLVFGLTACGGTIEKADTPVASVATGAAGETAQTKQVVGVSMGATTMDPAHEYEWDAEMMLHSVYPTLVTSDYADESKILPCVASEWVISDDGLTYTFTLNQGIQFTTGKELANPTVREAIRYAIDYPGLCALTGNGAATPAGIILKGFLGYAGETTITRDVEKAKALLTEAGYPDGITFSMGVIPDMAPDGVSFMTLAQKVQADLAEAGITVNIEPQEVAVYLEGYRDGKQQSVMCQWGPDDNDSNNQLAFLPGNTVGLRLGWTAEMDPELAELGQKASVETDSDKRAELFTEIQKQMDEKNAPAVVLLQPGKTWAVSSRLKNLTVSAAFSFDFVSLDVQ